MMPMTLAQAQLSPRSQERAKSQLARARSVSHHQNGSSALAAAAREASTTFLVHTFLENKQLDQLFLFVRQKRINGAQLEEALKKRKRTEFLRAFATPVPQFNSTVTHELARSAPFAQIAWMCSDVPELLHVREPQTGMTPLHVFALMREDVQSEAFVKCIWTRVDPKLLGAPDSSGTSVPIYLAMRNMRVALAAVMQRLGGEVAPLANGDTVETLSITNLERELSHTKQENRRLTMVAQTAEQTSADLKEMHSLLDKSITDRDKLLEQRDKELLDLKTKLNRMAEECDDLRDAQSAISVRGADNEQDLRRMRTELAEANAKAEHARQAFHDAVEKMRQSENTSVALKQERERLKEEMDEMAAKLKKARASRDERLVELEQEFGALRGDYDLATQQLNAHHEAHTYLSQEYEETRTQLDALRDELHATNKQFEMAQRESSKLRDEMRALQTQLSQRAEQIVALRSERDALRSTQAEISVAAALNSSQQRIRVPSSGGDSSDTEQAVGAMNLLQQQLDSREQELQTLQKRLRETLEEQERMSAALTRSLEPPPLPPPLPPPSRATPTDELESVIRRNHRLNADFYGRLSRAVTTGDHLTVQAYFNLGLSPNTRNFVGEGQTLLQVAVMAACETHSAQPLMNAKEHKLLIENLERTVRTIIENGGDWDGLDEFLEKYAKGDKIPTRIEKLLRARDDIAPFCKAMLAADEDKAIEKLDTVEDLMRVPSKFAQEKMSYLHIAAANGHAKLVQRMVLGGMQLDANLRDAKDRTPLHVALQKCTNVGKRRMIVESLLAAGAHPTLPCTYTKLNQRAKKQIDKRTARSASIGSASESTAQAILERMSTEGQKYGTPLALADALGATDLVDCMKNRRYLRVTVNTRDKDEYNAPLLQDYVIMCVSLHVQMKRLLDTGIVSQDSSLARMYQRYGNVFQCFNPHFSAQLGGYGAVVLDHIYADAGIPDRHTLVSASDRENEVLVKFVANDQAVLVTSMGSAVPSTATDQSTENRANANLFRSVCQLLIQCTDAIRGRWFEVSPMIEQPARALHERAARLALCHFVSQNRVAEIDYMLNRTDKLFGALDVNSIVDEKRNFTPIELATHCGVADTLEYFLERQRQRIDSAHPKKGTLIQIARDARQSISVVVIDRFKFQSRICSELHPNALIYDMTTPDSGNTVLAECAKQHRVDLMRYCIDVVAFQVEKPNNSGETPLRIVETMLTLQQISAEATHQWRRCASVLKHKANGEDDSEESVTGSVSTSLSATPRGGDDWQHIDMRAVQSAALESATQAVLGSSRGSSRSHRKHHSHHHSSSKHKSSSSGKHKKKKETEKEEDSLDEEYAKEFLKD